MKRILFLLVLLLIAGCSSLPGLSGKTKVAGDSCVLPGNTTCAAIPQVGCQAAKGRYQAYTCASVGFPEGPCGSGRFGSLYTSSTLECYKLKAAQKALGQ
ncbi:MAG: hypothetical protein HS115_03450 [Spirochaetales bacterium]|nr:hypothetical protein [Spirochaetales bacterium]